MTTGPNPPIATAAHPPARFPASRVLAAGVAAAAADALWGIAYFVGYLEVITVGQFFQSIARGLLGRPAFDGGPATAVLGAALHLLIGCIWAAIYALALRSWPGLRARAATDGGAVVAGLLFGAVIWLGMDLVVLPLSAAPAVPVQSPRFLLQLVMHALVVGPPIALVLRPGAPAGDRGSR